MLRALVLAFTLLVSLSAQERAISIVPSGDRRVALLIGNDRYADIPLKNAVNDAKAMGVVMKELGFEVEVVANADRRSADRAVDRFIGRLGVNSVGLFFYAGHGIQVEGENYLLGVDFSASSEEEAKYQGLPVSLVMDRLQKARARLSVMILDACRDNPFRGSRGSSRGLATMNAGRGSFIAFATSPGQTAADVGQASGVGAGGNGLFTASLLENLKQPDLDIGQVFDRTRERVYVASKEKQLPWTASSVIGSFIFRDLATQERRVAEERAKLEAELAKLQAGKAANQQRLGAAVTLRREQELQDQLRLKGQEEKGLADEGDRRRRLRADAAHLDEAAKAQTAQREQQRQVEEVRLSELKRKLDAERTGLGSTTLTLMQARAEVSGLTKKKAEIEQRIQAEKSRALASLEADFWGLAPKGPSPAPRDEFETTAGYQARLAEHAKAKSDLDAQLRQRKESLEGRYGEALAEQVSPYAQQIEALAAQKYSVPLQVTLGKYDPDQGQYTLELRPSASSTSRGYRAILKVMPEAARGLKARAAQLKAEGESGLEGQAGQMVVIDPALGRLPLQGIEEEPLSRHYQRNHLGMTFAEIPAGTFTMGGRGSGEKQQQPMPTPGVGQLTTPVVAGSGSNEQPQHTVSVPSFWLGTTTVTQSQWRAVMGYAPSQFKGDDLPVEHLSWGDVQRFIVALNTKETDRSYRLPSEAEWEYACRAGTTGETYGELNAIGWYDANSGRTTHPVGLKQANAFGLYDMLGNVWQWCEDPWHDTYQGAPTDGSVWQGSDLRHVLRGGSWESAAQDLRSANRFRDIYLQVNSASAGVYIDAFGFRLVCVPKSTDGD